MATEMMVEAIDRQEWLEPVGQNLQQAVVNTFEAAGPAGRAVKNFLHGTWLGHPLHPVLTDIPLGAWTAALVLDLMEEVSGREEFGRGADVAVAVGLAGAAGAAISGLTDWAHTDGRARRIGLTHGLLNTATALLYSTSLLLRKRNERRAGRTLAYIGYAVGGVSAYLGDHLVFGEQIGVDHTAAQAPPREFVPVIGEGELREGELRRVEAKGVPVLLVRRGGQIFALAETCSHLGGPLSEGKIEGNSVRCPWHGSRFALADGRVLDGPSAYQQPCFEIRVRDGQIEVRAATR